MRAFGDLGAVSAKARQRRAVDAPMRYRSRRYPTPGEAPTQIAKPEMGMRTVTAK